jgi:hypothetical protein
MFCCLAISKYHEVGFDKIECRFMCFKPVVQANKDIIHAILQFLDAK